MSQKAIITGGSRGIGEAMVKRFTEAGANVVFTGRGVDGLKRVEALVTAAGGCAVGVQADVSSVDDSRRVVELTVERFGGVDILVNNAASFPGSTGLDMTEDVWDETFDTDAKGTFFMAQLAAKAMIAAGHGGRIINFLSTAALRPTSPLIAYGAAKSAVLYITETLAQELAPYRILVNAVTPGATMTAERVEIMGSGNLAETMLGDNAPESMKALQAQLAGSDLSKMLARATPLGRTGWPDDLAKTVLFLASPMGNIKVKVSGQLADGKLTGTIKIPFGSIPFTAERA